MTVVTDQIAQFSTAIAFIYEAHMADAQREKFERALRVMLDVDELVFTTTRSAQIFDDSRYAESSSSQIKNSETSEHVLRDMSRRRPVGNILSLDIIDRGFEKLKLLVVRKPGRAPFSEYDLRRLSLLRPHLQNSEFIKALMPGGMYGCAASGRLVQSMCDGVVITTTDGEIKWLNPSAQDILAADHGLASVNGRLSARRAFETTQMDSLVRGAASGRSGVMLVANTSMWLPYGLAFTPFAFDFTLATAAVREPQSTFVQIIIKDMQRHVDNITKRLVDVFGFTEAEVRIGALLLSGHGLAAAAAAMGKSIATVKKQLRSMLAKTGARSQAELLGMLLSVPSLI